jgi:hypothetical protein
MQDIFEIDKELYDGIADCPSVNNLIQWMKS